MIRPSNESWDTSGFEDVRVAEARARKEHEDFCKRTKHSIALCDAILQLESSSAFRAFHEILADMLMYRTTELLSAREDRASAILQGCCIELRQMLGVLRETRGKREGLAKALADAEASWVDIERGFKPAGTNS